MRFGTWNVRRPYWSGALTTVVREMTRYKLDLVGVQEVRRDKRGIVRARIYIFSMEMEMKIMKWESFFLFVCFFLFFCFLFFCTPQNSNSS